MWDSVLWCEIGKSKPVERRQVVTVVEFPPNQDLRCRFAVRVCPDRRDSLSGGGSCAGSVVAFSARTLRVKKLHVRRGTPCRVLEIC